MEGSLLEVGTGKNSRLLKLETNLPSWQSQITKKTSFVFNFQMKHASHAPHLMQILL